ncbi:hypothetical protein JCM19237_5045 [Photobacterium aphoticum]|uniref:Uncharacterized protein n=1 Tax=Photobacterium aphoticum TaxID=754436 RepID=A0A090R3C2_9GAMM|nr:hypothetical protein JCM19237_5045 [Photobacterium aphoticum]
MFGCGILFIEYKRDDDVDEILDKKLRTLLSTCFTGEDDAIFRTQRYAKDKPQHRYLLWNTNNELVGQVAVHEKTWSAKAFRSPSVEWPKCVCYRRIASKAG